MNFSLHNNSLDTICRWFFVRNSASNGCNSILECNNNGVFFWCTLLIPFNKTFIVKNVCVIKYDMGLIYSEIFN